LIEKTQWLDRYLTRSLYILLVFRMQWPEEGEDRIKVNTDLVWLKTVSLLYCNIIYINFITSTNNRSTIRSLIKTGRGVGEER
jgi:hypothetical protein